MIVEPFCKKQANKLLTDALHLQVNISACLKTYLLHNGKFIEYQKL